MQEVTVKVSDLLTELTGNLANHLETYERARDGYRKHAIKTFKTQLKRAEDGDNFRDSWHLDPPQDHSTDYEAAIEMLKMTKKAGVEQIVITYKDFCHYVRDDWGWKDSWVSNTSQYT